MSEDHPDAGATSGTPGGEPQGTPPPPPPPPPAAPAGPAYDAPTTPLTPPAYAGPTPPDAPPPADEQLSGAGPHYDGEPVPAGAYGDTDILPTEPPKGGGRRGLILGAAALVLALVAGVGVVFATKVGGGGTQPEELVPAGAFAFGKVDLDPSADQKVAIREFANKFPSTPKPQGDDDIMDSLLRKLVDEANKEEPDCQVNFDTEVKSWLGDRFGIAAIAGTDGKVAPLGVIQSKDDAKAGEFLKKVTAAPCLDEGDDVPGYEFHKGYVVIGKSKDEVAAAIKAADESSLADNKTFTDDVAKLDGNQVMVTWADISKAWEQAKKQSPEIADLPTAFADKIKGRVVFGLHMETDYAELHGRSIGNADAAAASGSIDNFSTLPKNTVAAVAINGLEEQITKALNDANTAAIPVDDFLAQFEAQTGLNFKTDLLPVLGDKTSISLGSVPTGPDVKVGMTSKVKNPDAARGVGQKLAELSAQFGFPIESDVAGDTFYLASGGYLAELKSDKGLGESPTFTRAMGDLGDKLTAAMYVDLGQLVKLAEEDEAYKDLQHLSAIGMSAGQDGDEGYFRFRLVVK